MISHVQRLTPEGWAEWKENPFTRELFSFLEREAEAQRVMAAAGSCKVIDNQIVDFQKTGIAYTYRMLLAEVYENLINIELEDIIDEVDSSRT